MRYINNTSTWIVQQVEKCQKKIGYHHSRGKNIFDPRLVTVWLQLLSLLEAQVCMLHNPWVGIGKEQVPAIFLFLGTLKKLF
jgi:hypothetical protein